MDNIEITVFDEIKDYKEKIYFLNFRQWIFAILIIVIVVPTYLILKDRIGEEITSYIVIAIGGILGFIGFVKIHELPAEKIIPYWFRHYFLFAKPIHYISDEEYKMLHQKKKQNVFKVGNTKISKTEKKEMKKKQKQEKMLEKARKKYGEQPKEKIAKEIKPKKVKKTKETDSVNEEELAKKLSKLSKEQQEALLKLLER